MSFFEEPTFTLEEFVYSWHPHNFVPTNIEQMMYFNIKAGMLIGPWAVRTAYFMRGGLAFLDAGYLASQESYAIYRWMTGPQRKLASLKQIGTVPIAVSLFGRHLLDEYGSPEFQGPGQGRLAPVQSFGDQLTSVAGLLIGRINPFR